MKLHTVIQSTYLCTHPHAQISSALEQTQFDFPVVHLNNLVAPSSTPFTEIFCLSVYKSNIWKNEIFPGELDQIYDYPVFKKFITPHTR